MKYIVIALLALTSAAEAQTAKKAAAKAAVQADNGAPPKGSKEVSPGVFKFTDKSGKDWFYTQTPFGWTRGEQLVLPTDGTPDVPTDITVEDKGAELEFTRATPFGPSKWTKKKTELDAIERGVWTRAQAISQK
jgi:hypothetical protein